MTNKFKEIKKVEEEIKAKIEEERKKGESKVAEIEKEEDTMIDKMRTEIRNKRHEMLEKVEKEAGKEAETIISEADGGVKKIKVSDAAINDAAKEMANYILSLK